MLDPIAQTHERENREHAGRITWVPVPAWWIPTWVTLVGEGDPLDLLQVAILALVRIGRTNAASLADDLAVPPGLAQVVLEELAARALVATAMFQKRADQQILRVLQRIRPAYAAVLGSIESLLALADASPCPHLRSIERLRLGCDLTKDPEGHGICGQRPDHPCHLKGHSEQLKRYGHFGKVPTSLALAVREAGVTDLAALRGEVLQTHRDPVAAAWALHAALCRAWRVDQKIAAMFLSLVSNPDLCPGVRAPWSEGVDWTQYVVVDSNVDGFLHATGYPGPWTYEARRLFLRALAERVDLAGMKAGLHRFNPRLVQQALYLFMSRLNRRASGVDCSKAGLCARCRVELRGVCLLAR
ncbi:MAG: hypothetical protein ABIO70_13795 [Pseudomonadota bacterium]